jgi:hypothetical protein
MNEEEEFQEEGFRAEGQRAIDFRKRGHTYEEIAETLRITPRRVYAECHPEKSMDQIRAWEEKHHPELAAI